MKRKAQQPETTPVKKFLTLPEGMLCCYSSSHSSWLYVDREEHPFGYLLNLDDGCSVPLYDDTRVVTLQGKEITVALVNTDEDCPFLNMTFQEWEETELGEAKVSSHWSMHVPVGRLVNLGIVSSPVVWFLSSSPGWEYRTARFTI